MKEILKYLRQINSLTQDEIAKKINISRQWYIKFEKGLVQPSSEIIKKLSEFYQVSEDFIYKNKVPSIKEIENQTSEHKTVKYKINKDYGKLALADSGIAVAVAEPAVITKEYSKNKITIQGYFDGKAIQIDTPENIQQSFFQGQRFQLIPLYDEKEEERRKEAWKELQSLVGSIKVPDDFDVKEELYKALEEKYLKD
ncbi:MAG: helix-turn-helix transcriptional regulator [Treponema sp.]|nr:helix-turn-helix transcriptional regulator [Treponema sp.]